MQSFAVYVPLVASLIAAPLVAQTSDTPAQVTPAAIDAGRTIFHGAGTCFACHGANLEGAIGPQLTAHEWKDAKGGTFDAIVGIITKGVDGTAMVSHPGGISDAQVQQVAAYIWAVSHGKAKP
jgi:cytochrome c oxidase cbb3-type subunit 3